MLGGEEERRERLIVYTINSVWVQGRVPGKFCFLEELGILISNLFFLQVVEFVDAEPGDTESLLCISNTLMIYIDYAGFICFNEEYEIHFILCHNYTHCTIEWFTEVIHVHAS